MLFVTIGPDDILDFVRLSMTFQVAYSMSFMPIQVARMIIQYRPAVATSFYVPKRESSADHGAQSGCFPTDSV